MFWISESDIISHAIAIRSPEVPPAAVLIID